MLEAISSNSVALDSVVIIKGIQIMHQYFNNTDIPDGYILGTQKRGYLNNNFTFKWIQYFNKQSVHQQISIH